MKLRLYFSTCAGPGPCLIKTAFSHPLIEGDLAAIRGKSDLGLLGCGSFQWTSAVQATVALFLEIAVAKNCPNRVAAPVVLQGGKDSLASSLDYALAKKPLWISDMFGVDSKGNPLLTRILRVINSGRKLGDVVTVGMPGKLVRDLSVVVYVDDCLEANAIRILKLRDSLVTSKTGRSSFRNRSTNQTERGCQSGYESKVA